LIVINKKYNYLGSDSRYFIISGGRGSGKSYSVNSFLLLLTYEAGHTILFTRYTLTSAHVSIIPEFIDKIDTANLHDDFYITKDEIVNKITGSKILFRGIKTSAGTQTANLKSLANVTTWVLDEAEELVDEDTFDKIDLSIRQQTKQNRVILILNPATKEHFIYNRFFESKGVNEGSTLIKDDTTYIHSTYLDNFENLSESFIKQIEKIKETQPQKYNHVILGGWLNKAEGVIFTNWKTGEYIDTGFGGFGQDYGFSVDPTTLVQISIDKAHRKIYVKEHFYKTNLTTSEIFNLNLSYAGKTGYIVGDNSEGRLISELKSKGLNIKPITKPKIIERIALLLDYELIIHPDSVNTIKELNNYVWHDKKSETPIDNYNHILDGLGYIAWDLLAEPNKGKYHVY
jgi:phage terminase large subunit